MLVLIIGFILIGIIVFVLLILGLIYLFDSDFEIFESGKKRAGRRGEEYASKIMGTVLREGDVLLNNVEISFDGKPAELDSVVINNRGVFIIEVKNYSGVLFGSEDDGDWVKSKTTEAGNEYVKTVRNPIKQVRRQVYVLANYLKQYGIDVWVEGYAYLVNKNSPVHTSEVLVTPEDIDRVIHKGINNNITAHKKEQIVKLLDNE